MPERGRPARKFIISLPSFDRRFGAGTFRIGVQAGKLFDRIWGRSSVGRATDF